MLFYWTHIVQWRICLFFFPPKHLTIQNSFIYFRIFFCKPMYQLAKQLRKWTPRTIKSLNLWWIINFKNHRSRVYLNIEKLLLCQSVKSILRWTVVTGRYGISVKRKMHVHTKRISSKIMSEILYFSKLNKE